MCSELGMQNFFGAPIQKKARKPTFKYSWYINIQIDMKYKERLKNTADKSLNISLFF